MLPRAKQEQFVFPVTVFFVIVLAAVLRFFSLDSLPPGLYRDEAANGFDAWCILNSLRDRYANFLPLHFRAFNDWRECIFNYSLVPFVGLFGLSAFAVRAGTAFWGVITVAGVMFFARSFYSRIAAVCAGLVLALMPWHIYLSRFGARAITGPAFVLGSGYFFWLWIEVEDRKPRFLIAAALFLGLGFYTYTPMKLFLTLFALVLVLINVRKLKRADIKTMLIGFGLFCVVVSPVAYEILFGDTQARFNSISVFSVGKTKLDVLRLFVKNYAAHFRAGFLFYNATLLRWMPKGFGLLFYSFVPLLIAFFVRLVKLRERRDFLILFWILLSPVAAGLTVESIPHPIRTLMAVPAVALACGAGLGFIVERLKAVDSVTLKKCAVGVFVLWAMALSFESLRFDRYYFGAYRMDAVSHFQYGYKDVVDFIEANKNNYKEIVFHAPYNSDYYRRPFIFYAFYSKLAPEFLHKELDGLGYKQGMTTRFFDKFRVNVSRARDKELADGTLLIGMGDRTYDIIPGARLIHTVKRPDGHDAFRIYSVVLPPSDGEA